MIDTRTAPYATSLQRLTSGGLFLILADRKPFVFTPGIVTAGWRWL